MKTIHTLAWVIAFAAPEAAAQLNPFDRAREKQQEEMIEKLKKENAGSVPGNQDAMEQLRKQTEDQNRLLHQRQPTLELPKFKPEDVKLRPIEPGTARPRPQAAPTAPPPSRVTYGETRPLTGARQLPKEDASKPKPAAPRPAEPERPACVFKPVMTDAEIAACR